MKYIGWTIIALGLALIGIAITYFEHPVVWTLLGLFVMYCGDDVSRWTVKDVGSERIVLEPSPTPGFNSWYETRTITGWVRHTDLSGWGTTQESAEANCRTLVAQAKANDARLETTPTKVVSL